MDPMEDALVLADELGKNSTVPATFAAFMARRLPRVQFVLSQAHEILLNEMESDAAKKAVFAAGLGPRQAGITRVLSQPRRAGVAPAAGVAAAGHPVGEGAGQGEGGGGEAGGDLGRDGRGAGLLGRGGRHGVIVAARVPHRASRIALSISAVCDVNKSPQASLSFVWRPQLKPHPPGMR